MNIQISMLGIIKIKINLMEKKLLNHLKNYVINKLIFANLMKSIINLWMML